MMNEEGVFPRLLELIQDKVDDDTGLHRMMLDVLYEMSRIQRLRMEDLSGHLLGCGKIKCAANQNSQY